MSGIGAGLLIFGPPVLWVAGLAGGLLARGPWRRVALVLAILLGPVVGRALGYFMGISTEIDLCRDGTAAYFQLYGETGPFCR